MLSAIEYPLFLGGVDTLPWSALPISFEEQEIRIADMNGDGLSDIIRLRKGDIRYWPGRGDGTFGTGPLGKQGPAYSQDTYVKMSTSPWYTQEQERLRFGDVNGDGLADLIQTRYDHVDIYTNVDGRGWTDREMINDLPWSPGWESRTRIVDMNGSGTLDVVWGQARNYRYLDLLPTPYESCTKAKTDAPPT